MQIQILVTRNVCVEIIANLHHFSGTQVHSRRCASDLPFLSCRRTSLPSTSPSPRDAFDSIRLDTNRTEPLDPLRYRRSKISSISRDKKRKKKEERRREPRTFRSRQRRHLTSSRFGKLRVSFRKRSDSCRSGSVGFEEPPPWRFCPLDRTLANVSPHHFLAPQFFSAGFGKYVFGANIFQR